MTTQPPENPSLQPTPPIASPAPQPDKNPLGLAALITSIIGFIFACIPGALIIGWILLPVSFILAVIALVRPGPKKFGVIALVLSIVGTIVGFVVFFAVVVDAVDEAFSDGETAITAPDGEESPQDNDDSDDAAAGTRENPLPIGSTIENDDWAVTINDVDLDGTDAVLDNEFNEPPGDGNVYILVNVTAKYVGDEADGETAWVSIDYVSTSGNSFSDTDSWATPPEPFDSFETLYNGAAVTGNMVIEVPADGVANGVLAVNPSLMGDKVYFAVK